MFEKISSTWDLIAAGFFGALISIRFRKDLKTKWQIISAVASGTVIAYFSGPLVLYYFGLRSEFAFSVTFILGLFGMAIVASIMNAIPEFIRARAGRGGQ